MRAFLVTCDPNYSSSHLSNLQRTTEVACEWLVKSQQMSNCPGFSALSWPSHPILLYTMDSDKMTIKELKSILRKKDFLLQVKRQT
jgi:hypothetical protein